MEELNIKGSFQLKSYQFDYHYFYFGSNAKVLREKVLVECTDGCSYKDVHNDKRIVYVNKIFFDDHPWLKVGDTLHYVIKSPNHIVLDIDVENRDPIEIIDPYEVIVRDFLATRVGILDEGLQLYKGIQGKEFKVGKVGKIDLLCVDKSDNFVVVELKKSNPSDKAVGQILRYVGWVKENLAKDKEVRGIIVAIQPEKENSDYEKLRYAVAANSDLQLKYYRLFIELENK